MPRVFVPQVPYRRSPNGGLEQAYDLSAAEVHGTLVELVSPSAKPWTQSVVSEMRDRLLDHDITPDDYVLLVGSPAMCALAVAQMSDLLDGCIKMLQWDGHKREYFPICVEL